VGLQLPAESQHTKRKEDFQKFSLVFHAYLSLEEEVSIGFIRKSFFLDTVYE